jgi:hypothetical protein
LPGIAGAEADVKIESRDAIRTSLFLHGTGQQNGHGRAIQ